MAIRVCPQLFESLLKWGLLFIRISLDKRGCSHYCSHMASLWKREHSKYWTACFTDKNGRRLKKSTKEIDRRKAQKIANEFEAASQRRQTAMQVRKVIAELHKEITEEDLPMLTVREFVERWIGRKTNSVGRATLVFYKGATNKLLSFLVERADRDIGEITRDDITAFRDNEAKRVAPRTVNHNLKCARMLFKDAKRDNLIPEDPTEFVEAVRAEPKVRLPTYSLDQLKALISAADEEWRSMIYFGIYAGQRLGDIARLSWDNVDLQSNTIRIVTGKTGRSQTIPIAPTLREQIEKLDAGDDPSQPLHPRAYKIVEEQGKTGSLSVQFAALLASIGLREKKTHKSTGKGRAARREGSNALTFHSLRRTATTLLHEAGIPAAVAQEFIGHDSAEMHSLYVSVGSEAIRDAAAKLPIL